MKIEISNNPTAYMTLDSDDMRKLLAIVDYFTDTYEEYLSYYLIENDDEKIFQWAMDIYTRLSDELNG